ncbi:hypothetical protein O181_012997 [Austropuccinia psidii MF-1]|uniref:Uncharacterized protein n=1 Tax=Austropuccinia psidii MF-1 TaxID=1389203 RepID=A0A9Q3BYS1_9BASI|nr:hypothetical protein [Austropuccinia psidii MF-1]
MGTGNLKITYHLKFLQNSFPAKNGDNIDSDEDLFILVLNEIDISSGNKEPDHRKSSSVHNTPEGQILEPVIPSLALDPGEPDPLLSTAQDLLVKTSNLTVHKGYSWIPEHKINSFQELFGNIGDLKNILNHPRHPKHHANSAKHLSIDPKTYI